MLEKEAGTVFFDDARDASLITLLAVVSPSI
jgi:hypothetical protein